jgi:LCP family protein required for cell wall assembly
VFDWLDDDEEFTPDAAFRARAIGSGRRRRARGRVTIALGAFVVMTVLVTGVAFGYARWRIDRIEHVDVATTPAAAGSPVNFLFVGTDSTTRDDPAARADTVIVARWYPDDATVRLLSLPRDLWLASGERLSAARTGGRDALVAAVGALGIPVNHYVELDMGGAAAVADAVGGIDVAVAQPMRDASTGLSLVGCQHLDSAQVLALVRSRHLEALTDGIWVTDPRAELGRVDRARTVLGFLAAEVIGAADEPLTLDRLAQALTDHAVLDDGLGLSTLVSLGTEIAGAPLAVDGVTLPVQAATVGRAAVLEPTADAAAVLDDFGPEASLSPPPPAGPTGGAESLFDIRAC